MQLQLLHRKLRTTLQQLFFMSLGTRASCLLGVWNCPLGVWICLFGVWNRLLGVWNGLLDVWHCLLGVLQRHQQVQEM